MSIPKPSNTRQPARPPGGLGLSRFRIQVGENLLDDLWITDRRCSAPPHRRPGRSRCRFRTPVSGAVPRSSTHGVRPASVPPHSPSQHAGLPCLVSPVLPRAVLAVGRKTPWNRVRLTRGFGTRAARRAMKSSSVMCKPSHPWRDAVLRPSPSPTCRGRAFAALRSDVCSLRSRLTHRGSSSSACSARSRSG